MKNEKMMSFTFSSVKEFKKYLDFHAHIEPRRPSTSVAKTVDNLNNPWSGVKDWEGFETILEEGDEGLLKAVVKSTNKNISGLEKKYDLSTSYTSDVEGVFFDVGKVLIGEPEAWLKEEDEPVVAQTYEFNVYGSYTSDVDQVDILEGASKVLAMAKALELMGVSTQISYHFDSIGSSRKNEKDTHSVKMIAKKYEAGLNFKTASTVMHPSFFRRGVLRLREMSLQGDLTAGYGRSDRSKEYICLDNTRQLKELEKHLFSKVKRTK